MASSDDPSSKGGRAWQGRSCSSEARGRASGQLFGGQAAGQAFYGPLKFKAGG